MEDSRKRMAYIFAKHKAEKLKSFYIHSIVYFIINTFMVVFKITRNLNNGETFNEVFFDLSTFITPLIWGILILIHAFSVFGPNVILGRDWEERKLREYMKQEEE